MLWKRQISNYREIHTWKGSGVQTGYWVGKRRNVLPDLLTAADPIPAWLSPVAGDDPTGGGPVGTADTRVWSYTAVRKNTFRGCIVCTLLCRRVLLGGLSALLAAWCPLVSPPSPSAALCTGAVSPIPIGTWLLPVGVGTLGHTPEPKPRCILMPVHRSSPCRPCSLWRLRGPGRRCRRGLPWCGGRAASAWCC